MLRYEISDEEETLQYATYKSINYMNNIWFQCKNTPCSHKQDNDYRNVTLRYEISDEDETLQYVTDKTITLTTIGFIA